jgi:DNA-binding response OmpR family regulator
MDNYYKVLELTNKLNILFVEDDKNFRKETAEIFDELFLSVDIATNGIEAIEKYKNYYETTNRYYDIVITDINMPKMDGIALTKEIYHLNNTQTIIIVSAYNDSEYLLELISIGIEHFFIKPLDFDLVLDILQKVAIKIINSSSQKIDTDIIQLKDSFRLDKQKKILTNNNSEIKLTKNEIQIVTVFIKNSSRVSTIEELTNSIDSCDTLKSIISRLRKKLPNNSIENIYSLGYRLLF